VACYALHTGCSVEEIAVWWRDVSEFIPKTCQDWPMKELCTKDCDLNALRQMDYVPFDVNVHTHASLLQDQLIQVLRPQCGRKCKRSKKTTLSDETWQIVL
jgi:hypothetical protein